MAGISNSKTISIHAPVKGATRYFNELTAEKRKEYSQRATEKQRERRDARYAAGLCVICGKRPPRDNRRTCALCSSKRTGARQRKAEIEEETET